MSWKSMFAFSVLSRGQYEYQSGHLANFIKEGSHFEAWVEGNEDYHVTAEYTGETLPQLTCSCGYGTEAYPCVHMAALMFRIEAEENNRNPDQKRQSTEKKVSAATWKGASAEKPVRVYPFGQDPTLLWEIGVEEELSYKYFDLAVITKDYSFYSDDCSKARRGIERGLAVLEHLNCSYEPSLDSKYLVCTVSAKIKQRGTFWPVFVAFNHSKILKLECQVPGCDCNKSHVYLRRLNDYGRPTGQERLCAHMIAALFLAEEKLKEINPGDNTDRMAQRMLSAYRKRRAAIFSEAENAILVDQISIEPRLTLEKDGLRASFRAGTDKMYVLKSLPAFVDAAEKKTMLEVGTQKGLNMAIHDFSPTALGYYEFLRNIIRGEQSRSRFADSQIGRNADLSEYIKDSIPLYGKRLDDFFELAKGRKLSFHDKQSGMITKTIQLLEKDPMPKLTLRSVYDRGIFFGVRIEGEVCELIEGEQYAYFLDKNMLCRVSREGREKLAPLLKLADYANQIHFTVGVNHLSELYYRVLPVLRDCAVLEEPDAEEIAAYLPAEAEFRFYMDIEEGRISCRPMAVYEEKEYALFEWESGRISDRKGRDEQLEREALQMIRHFFPEECEKGAPERGYCCRQDPDVAYELLENGLARILEYGEIRATERFRRLRVHRTMKFSLGISLESNLLNLEVVSEEFDREELLQILQSYRQKKKYYRMLNGDFLRLEQENLAELSAMLDALQVSPGEFVSGKMQLPLYRALYLNAMLEENEDIYAKRDSHFKRLVKDFKTVRDSDFEVPVHLRQIMRNYQIYGYRWLRTLQQGRFGGILADDMGLGKTLQMISLIAADHAEKKEEEADGEHVSLIVCPASLVYNWAEEFHRFAPELNVLPVTGTLPVRKEKIAAYEEYDVLITSYDLLKRDAAEYENIAFAYEVIDEAQYIKNHATEAAKAVKIMKAKWRFALTGTPIENRLSELWSIFDYLMPGYLYDYATFRKEFEIPIVKQNDQAVAKELRRMVSPFILRRLKKDVLKDLPDKLEEVRYAKLDTEQRQLYDAQVLHMRQMLEGMDESAYQRNRITVLAEITKIRQFCCDPSLQVDGYHGGSAKREACMDLIRSAIEGEHKILVFSSYVSMLELLEKDLREAEIPYYMITGSVPKEKRLELVKAFNKDTTPVFLISLKAGGTGLNLTGADIVIHYDPWWNLAAQNQATDRAHRIGQTRVVFVYRLIAKDTIEERILQMQEEKQNLADSILNGENGNLGSLSREELASLFA